MGSQRPQNVQNPLRAKFKMTEGGHLENAYIQYLHRILTDFDEIWCVVAAWLPGHDVVKTAPEVERSRQRPPFLIWLFSEYLGPGLSSYHEVRNPSPKLSKLTMPCCLCDLPIHITLKCRPLHVVFQAKTK